MSEEIPWYKKRHIDELPYVHELGHSVEELRLKCARCRERVELHAQHVHSLGPVIDIKIAGFCRKCDLITTGQTRFGKGNRIQLRTPEGVWRTGKIGPTFWNSVGRFLKSLIITTKKK